MGRDLTFLGVLSDLHLGDQRVTWKKLGPMCFRFSLSESEKLKLTE